MKKILLDSSVWVSFFAQDCHYLKSQQILLEASREQRKIVVPEYVYSEVMTSLHNLKVKKEYINNAKKALFDETQIEMVHIDSKFWLHDLEKYFGKTKSKAADLIIIAFAIEMKTNGFYTLDRQQAKNYKLLTQ